MVQFLFKIRQLSHEDTDDIPNALSRQPSLYNKGIIDILDRASDLLAETDKRVQEIIEEMENYNHSVTFPKTK